MTRHNIVIISIYVVANTIFSFYKISTATLTWFNSIVPKTLVDFPPLSYVSSSAFSVKPVSGDDDNAHSITLGINKSITIAR